MMSGGIRLCPGEFVGQTFDVIPILIKNSRLNSPDMTYSRRVYQRGLVSANIPGASVISAAKTVIWNLNLIIIDNRVRESAENGRDSKRRLPSG